MMTINRTILRAPIARIEVDIPFYTGTVKAVYMKDLQFGLIVENVLGAKKPNDSNPEWGGVAAGYQKTSMGTRKFQATQGEGVDVNKEELVRLQKEDSTLQKI